MTTLINKLCENARKASIELGRATIRQRDSALYHMAIALVSHADEILIANEIDLENARNNGMSAAMLDRLTLTIDRISAIAESVRKVIEMPDPLISHTHWTLTNGLEVYKRRVPFGVVAIIYEARPNVTADAAALCIKSGNAVILRGGSEAINSNIAIANILGDALKGAGLPKQCINIVTDTSRETANKLMRAKGKIDLLIPRGGKSLIRAVVDNATVPVIETGAGNCHVYIDENADEEMALRIIENAKCSRPSVCNAVETLLVHKNIAGTILPSLLERLPMVELRGCKKTLAILNDPRVKPATREDYFTEYNDYILAIKVVSSLEEAIKHINTHGTKHSEAIVTENTANAEVFCNEIDAAAVYVNASTRFTDGEQFGFGAEIGISTQKMHARGPMGVEAITTYKFVVEGNGQIRK